MQLESHLKLQRNPLSRFLQTGYRSNHDFGGTAARIRGEWVTVLGGFLHILAPNNINLRAVARPAARLQKRVRGAASQTR